MQQHNWQFIAKQGKKIKNQHWHRWEVAEKVDDGSCSYPKISAWQCKEK